MHFGGFNERVSVCEELDVCASHEHVQIKHSSTNLKIKHL